MMWSKKNLIFIGLLIFSAAGIFSQEESAGKEKKLGFIIQLEAGLYLNPEHAELNSAPSPINFQPSIGLLFPNFTHVAVQPTLTFFSMNHLWYEDRALPAEIENRTSTTLSFLTAFPATFTVFLSQSRLHLSAGPGIMIRYAFLAHGVSADDSGFTGTAASDIEAMNDWFWSDFRWLYVTLGADWLYHVTPQLKAGPAVNLNLPIGGLIADRSTQGLIISAGIKICR